MRKADYAALTEILREQLEQSRNAMRCTGVTDDILKIHHSANFMRTRDIAHACARRLNVDRVKFLAACGLAPD